MLVTNYPGNISTGIYNAISSYPLLFKIGWPLLFGTIVLFLSTVTFFKMQYPEKVNGLKRFKWILSPATFITILCIGVFVLRIPNLVPPRLSVDEDQWLVSGAVYAHGAVFWKTLSGNTSGPLVYVLPLIMAPFDGLNFASIRVFGLLFCIIPAIFLIWKTLKQLYGDITAQISVISLFIFFSSIDEGEFVAYNSEHFTMIISALSIYFLFRLVRATNITTGQLLALGITLGVMPYGKLQIMPIGLCLGLLGIFEIYRRRDIVLKKRMSSIFIFAIAAVIPSLIVAVYLTMNNAWADFWNNYLVNNFLYVSHKGANAETFDRLKGINRLGFVITLIIRNHYLIKFVLSQLLVVSAIIALQFNKNLFDKRTLWYSIVIAASAYLSVISPGNPFGHYIYLFIFPFVFVTGCFIGELLSQTSGSYTKLRVVYFAPPLIYILMVLWKSPIPQGTQFILAKKSMAISDESKLISKYAHPGESMSLWGWGTYNFIETGLIMINKTGSQFVEAYTDDHSPLVAEYIDAMKTYKPVVFFDVVPPINGRKQKLRHENRKKINDYILENYTEVGEINEKRVYVLNERKKEIDSLASHQ